MKLALVIPPADAAASETGLRALLPRLREHCEVACFSSRAGDDARAASELRPRDHDQIVFHVADHAACAFVLPLVQAFGGAVALHDWRLVELAAAAWPELDRGGWRGRWIAVREGGVAQARAYARCWSAPGAAPGAAPSARMRACAELALNRSVVRGADAFIVPDARTRDMILVERNAPTPIGILEPRADADELARAWVRMLERFPAPRSNRKSIVRALVDAHGHKPPPSV